MRQEIKVIEGHFDGANKRFGIIVSRFNDLVTRALHQGAIDCFKRHGVEESCITSVLVPGAFEIPLILKKMAETKKFEALIALGAVIRGSTSHYDYVCNEVSKGVASVGLSSGIPCIFGVLTTDTLEQALERAGVKGGNKGYEAALSALEMVSVLDKIHNL